MLLNRSILGLAKLASKKQSRYTLQAIAVGKEQAVATDGHIMAVVQTKPMDDSAMPVIEGMAPRTLADGEQVLVSAEAASAALKTIPKRSNLPILQNAAMGADGKLYTTDLENVSAFSHKVEGKFPDWKAVIPREAPVAEVSFDARKMIQLCDYIKQFSDAPCAVRLTIYSTQTAIRLDARTADGADITCLLMPLLGKSKFAARPQEIAPAIIVVHGHQAEVAEPKKVHFPVEIVNIDDLQETTAEDFQADSLSDYAKEFLKREYPNTAEQLGLTQSAPESQPAPESAA